MSPEYPTTKCPHLFSPTALVRWDVFGRGTGHRDTAKALHRGKTSVCMTVGYYSNPRRNSRLEVRQFRLAAGFLMEKISQSFTMHTWHNRYAVPDVQLAFQNGNAGFSHENILVVSERAPLESQTIFKRNMFLKEI